MGLEDGQQDPTQPDINQGNSPVGLPEGRRRVHADPPLLAAEDVSTDGKRDLAKAKAALARLYRERPRKMLAALEKYLAAKLADGQERLKRPKADEPRDLLAGTGT